MKEKNVKAKAPNKKSSRTDYKDFLLHCSLVQFWVLYFVIWFRTAALRKMSLLRAFCMSSDRDLSV